MQSKALDRFIRTATKIKFSSNFSLYSSNKQIRTCLFVNLSKSVKDAYESIVWSIISGFPLSTGNIEGILALSGKVPWCNRQFFAFVKGSAIISAPILIFIGGITSTSSAFLMSISFRSFFNFRSRYLLKIKTA